MTAKAFFLRARAAERDIKRLERLMDHFSSVGASVSSKWGGIGGRAGNSSSKVEAAAVGLFDTEKSILNELGRYRKIVAEAETVISRIPQERFRQILTLHYLAGMALADVARAMGYRHTENLYRAHGWALTAAQKIIDGREENGGRKTGKADSCDGP